MRIYRNNAINSDLVKESIIDETEEGLRINIFESLDDEDECYKSVCKAARN